MIVTANNTFAKRLRCDSWQFVFDANKTYELEIFKQSHFGTLLFYSYLLRNKYSCILNIIIQQQQKYGICF